MHISQSPLYQQPISLNAQPNICFGSSRRQNIQMGPFDAEVSPEKRGVWIKGRLTRGLRRLLNLLRMTGDNRLLQGRGRQLELTEANRVESPLAIVSQGGKVEKHKRPDIDSKTITLDPSQWKIISDPPTRRKFLYGTGSFGVLSALLWIFGGQLLTFLGMHFTRDPYALRENREQRESLTALTNTRQAYSLKTPHGELSVKNKRQVNQLQDRRGRNIEIKFTPPANVIQGLNEDQEVSLKFRFDPEHPERWIEYLTVSLPDASNTNVTDELRFNIANYALDNEIPTIVSLDPSTHKQFQNKAGGYIENLEKEVKSNLLSCVNIKNVDFPHSRTNLYTVDSAESCLNNFDKSELPQSVIRKEVKRMIEAYVNS